MRIVTYATQLPDGSTVVKAFASQLPPATCQADLTLLYREACAVNKKTGWPDEKPTRAEFLETARTLETVDGTGGEWIVTLAPSNASN